VKSIFLTIIALVLGGWMVWCGFKDYQNNNRLLAEGKTASAEVLDRLVKPGSRSGNRYYLSVQFQTATEQSVQKRVRVNRAEYLNSAAGTTVSLRYLPSDPAICAVGEPVTRWRGKFVSGGLLLLSGSVLLLLNRQRLTSHQAAEKIARSVAALCETHYEYAPVNARDFGHLDLSWYDASQRWIEQNGFALLGDEENLTFRRTSKGNRTLLRTMLNRDGTCLAYLYHFKPPTHVGTLGGDGFKILELQSHFPDGVFVCTSNAEAAGKLDSPPGVDALRLPHNTSLDAVLGAHTERLHAALANNPGAAAASMRTLDDVHRVQNVLQQIKATWRQKTGITREELQRLAGNRLCSGQVAALHADVEKLRGNLQSSATSGA